MTSMRSVALMVLGFLVTVEGCNDTGTSHGESTLDAATQARLHVVVEKFIKAKHPEWSDDLALPPTIADVGDGWSYSFVLPGNVAGGVPVIRVGKKSMAVEGCYHTQ